jgi:hypothetical protein
MLVITRGSQGFPKEKSTTKRAYSSCLIGAYPPWPFYVGIIWDNDESMGKMGIFRYKLLAFRH